MEQRALEEEALAARTTGATAFEHAFAAADFYMKAAQNARSAAERIRLRQKFNESITYAESIKSRLLKQETDICGGTHQSPSQLEDAILQKGSQLHGNYFPIWTSDPKRADFLIGDPSELFCDDVTFAMSARQREALAGWKRPRDLFETPRRTADPKSSEDLMCAKDDIDLVQDITTDCSVVASLCAAMKQLRPGDQSLLPSLMFPFDFDKGYPIVSPNGKYVFRMHFNGCPRVVVIDDRLPASKTDRSLFAVDRRNPTLLWPALMEKAYLKVRGGYDFPGSNSGTDLWVLTGWIPEQLFLQSDEFDLDKAWREITRAYHRGDVMVTLGTGRLSSGEEQALGLVGEHDYAILDVVSDDNDRRLLVKNPWCDGLIWKGRTALATPGNSVPNLNDGLETDSGSPTGLQAGSFWITLEDVAQNFESMYLNWNPSLFSTRQDRHFTWAPPRNSLAKTFANNPQFLVNVEEADEVWILLSRHFADAELEIAKQKTQSLTAISSMLGFTSIYIFNRGGRRIQLTDGYLYRGPYVDSPQTLARLPAEKGMTYTVVVAQQSLPLPLYSFTLSFLSSKSLRVSLASEEMTCFDHISSCWSRRTAGGNAASPLYSRNPQFSITVKRRTPLSLLLVADRADVAVHVDLVWAKGDRVDSLTMKEIAGTSGDYRLGSALAEIPSVDAGTYTAVCSTFEPGQLGVFTLRAGAKAPVVMKPVVGSSAGRLRTKLPALFFREGEERRRASLQAPRLTRAYVVASYGGAPRQTYAASIRISVIYGHGPDEKRIAVSGGDSFEEPTGLIKTSDFDIEPERANFEGLWVSVEQMGSSESRDAIEVEILGETYVKTGQWETVDS